MLPTTTVAPITIVDNEYITLQYLPDTQIIYHTIHQPVPDQLFRDALDAGTVALQRSGVFKWLSDDRKNGPLSEAFLEWSFNDWQPRTIAAGWKYWVNVVPEALVAAGTLAPVIDALYERGLHMMVFTDLEAATHWINKVKD